MRILELIRLEETELGTLGVLKLDKSLFCCTLEPADLLNRVNMSSIPAQQYICLPRSSIKYGFTFEVSNVPGRTGILFHAGNTRGDTEGCILLGEKFGKLQGNPAVLNSGETFKGFVRELRHEAQLHLTVKEEY